MCVKEIEDSELLEVMDVCDQEGGTNPTAQEHITPAPSTAQVIRTAGPESLKSAVMSRSTADTLAVMYRPVFAADLTS